jgi:hypothetical protein
MHKKLSVMRVDTKSCLMYLSSFIYEIMLAGFQVE